MKNWMQLFMILAVAGLFLPVQAFCGGGMSNEQIVEELKSMKERINELESELRNKDREIAELRELNADKSAVGVKGLGDRVRRIEDEMEKKKESVLGEWAERIHFSGLVETEAAYEDMDFGDPEVEDMDASDIALATVELGVDVDIAKHVQGHVLLLWEEDDTEPLDVDEGFIIIDGEDVVPLFLSAGKMYVPFGNFESHFVSDPLTLEIGETNESAVMVGFAGDWLDLSAAVYNGDVDEIDDDDDHINGFAAGAVFHIPDGMVPNLGLQLGASYISDIAESDGLEGELTGPILDHVSGFGAFLSAAFKETIFFDAEYVGASENFGAGELAFDNGRGVKPRAWNLELAFAPMDRLLLGLKYEGSDDLGDFLPEKQYGGVASYELFESTILSLEYLHGKFENKDERNLLTGQLAIEF